MSGRERECVTEQRDTRELSVVKDEGVGFSSLTLIQVWSSTENPRIAERLAAKGASATGSVENHFTILRLRPMQADAEDAENFEEVFLNAVRHR